MATRINPLAGQTAPPSVLVDVNKLVTAYYLHVPDATVTSQRVVFGTSGHRGSAFDCSFNEWHVLAITQAICNYRKAKGIGGPLFLGHRHPCAVAPRLRQRARSAGSQWRGCDAGD